MAIGLIIIGDEILSGKRVDQHLPKVIALLKERGLQLAIIEFGHRTFFRLHYDSLLFRFSSVILGFKMI